MPLSLLSRVAFGALLQPGLGRAMADDLCALADGLSGHAAVAGAGGARRPSRLEALPDTVLGEIYSYVSTLDVFRALCLASRRLRLRVFTPGGVTNLNFSAVDLGIVRALEAVPQARWSALHALCLSGLDLDTQRSVRAAVGALGALGPRLRVLHVQEGADEYVGLHHIPAAVWPALRELFVTMVEASPTRAGDKEEDEEGGADGGNVEEEEKKKDRRPEWSPARGEFGRLERLSLLARSQYSDGEVYAPTYRRCGLFLAAAVPGRLRELALARVAVASVVAVVAVRRAG